MRGSRRSGIGQALGFTLLELLVVLAIVALASAGVGFALRDDTATRLERDAQRLGALLEAARAQSQVTGVPVRWYVTTQGFRFDPQVRATQTESPTSQWLDPDTRAVIKRLPGAAVGGAGLARGDSLLLGPDAIISPQAVTLFSSSQPQQRVRLATDGARPFAVQADTP
jgi:general secretion pathway protein H